MNGVLLCKPKHAGGVGIIDLDVHMQACRATFIHRMLDNKLIWTACMWDLIHLGTIFFHGKWELSDWDKMFSHAPLNVYALTASTLIKSWKFCCARLIWKGRIRYTWNSLRSKNVHWSFIFKTPPAVSMGLHSRYLAMKGVMHLNHILDSKRTFYVFMWLKIGTL